MQKEIRLAYNIGKYVDGAKMISIDEDLEIVLNYEKPIGSKLYYCASNGSIIKKGIIENNKFTLEHDFIKLGSLNVKIEVEFLGNIVKTFKVEPLIIQELDKNIEAIPQMVEMKNKIEELSKKVEDLSNRLNLFIKMWKEEI